jgi:hypothetical protein
VLIFVLVSYAVTPISYILHLRKAHQKKKELEREIREIETESLSGQVPDEKDVESLWRLHGLDERECSLDMRLTLLDAWISILYGKGVSENVGLRSRGEGIAERRFNINLPYYQGKEGAPHFLLASPVDTLVRQLSDELPPYG